MIHFSEGNMFDAPVEALVNTVNLVGVMGKGVALQFKERFKDNFEAYYEACQNQSIGIGKSLVTKAQWNNRDIWLINFPTKIHWRNPSKMEYVEKGLDNLRDIITTYKIKSIAIPPLGAGNGGLDWKQVKPLIENKLSDIDCEILVYEPGHKAVSNEKKINLTPARALLTYMLDKLIKEGTDATAFGAVKLIYFMQKFGAEPIFKLRYQKYIYGPYNDQVRHMLYGIDGAYIRGFADKDKKPFEPFDINRERIQEVKSLVEGDLLLKDIVTKTSEFLSDNWDDFSLELLSSIDFLMNEDPSATVDELYERLCGWNARKGCLFGDKSLTIFAYEHILSFS